MSSHCRLQVQLHIRMACWSSEAPSALASAPSNGIKALEEGPGHLDLSKFCSKPSVHTGLRTTVFTSGFLFLFFHLISCSLVRSGVSCGAWT